MERKLSPPVWSDRVAVGPVDRQLAGDHVAAFKLHLGERDPIGPALAKLGPEFGVDIGHLHAPLLMNVLCYT
jgi:hypothetical protein